MVTSERADHEQGGSSTGNNRGDGVKSFAVKILTSILTSKLFVIKILRDIFADTAPVKASRRIGGGGYNPESEFSPTETRSQAVLKTARQSIFAVDFHRLSYQQRARRLNSSFCFSFGESQTE